MKDVLFKPSSPPLVGIDISTSSVKLIELAKAGNSYRVESFGAEPMPSNAITDKMIMDVDAAGEAVRKAVKHASPKTKYAAVAISGQVMTKTIQMPAKLSDKDLGEQIELQADQYISQPIDEVAFDYEIIGPSQYDPELVDVEAFALENACKLLTYQMLDEGLDRTIALVDFGAATTSFSVLHDRKIIYTYNSDFGGKQLTDEIMRHYGLTYEEAGKAKKEGGLPGNYKVEILDPFADDMAQTVNRSLQFFLSSTSEYNHLDQIIVCGGCAAIPGAPERISEKMGTPAVIGNPFGQMKIGSRAKTQLTTAESSALLVACGLA